MSNIKTLNYPGVLRAYNRIEESKIIKNKVEVLSALTSLIDRAIQIDLECVRQQHENISKSVAITEEEIRKLLATLEESDVVLYEGLANEDALIVKKQYASSVSNKAKRITSKRKINAKA